MNKLSIADKIRSRLSDVLFTLFLRVNNISKKDYYGQWVGYTKEDFEAMTTSDMLERQNEK